MLNVYEQRDANIRRSWLLIFLFILFITGVGWALTYVYSYDYTYLAAALAFSALGSITSYFFSDSIVLSLSGARPLNPREYPEYASAVGNLSRVAGIPEPKAYIIDSPALNAFATGRDPKHAAVAVTRGLLERLNRTELEGVVGHELSHIRNYDTRLMTIVATLVGAVAIILDWSWRMRWLGNKGNDREDRGSGSGIFMLVGLLIIILAPIIGNLIKLAISRRREYLADSSGVMLTRQPSGLISALQKIAVSPIPLETASAATAHLYISNPLKQGRVNRDWFASLFSTHPPVEDRIKALEGML